jgi:hypothetical protein
MEIFHKIITAAASIIVTEIDFEHFSSEQILLPDKSMSGFSIEQ